MAGQRAVFLSALDRNDDGLRREVRREVRTGPELASDCSNPFIYNPLKTYCDVNPTTSSVSDAV